MARRSRNTVNDLLVAVLAVCTIISFMIVADGLLKPGAQVAQVAVGTGAFAFCVFLMLTRPDD